MNRPEYVKCVGFGDAIRADNKKVWCGKQIPRSEVIFVNVTHAALNGEQEGRLIACPDCVKEITKHLNHGE